MLCRAAHQELQEALIGRQRAPVLEMPSSVIDANPRVLTREKAPENERNLSQTTRLEWDSEEGEENAADTMAKAVERELYSVLETYIANGDALRFWKAPAKDFSFLRFVACALLGASGSSAAFERDFFPAGLVLRKDRCNVLPEHVGMQCLVRFNTQLLPADWCRFPVLSAAATSITRNALRSTSIEEPPTALLPGQSDDRDDAAFSDKSESDGSDSDGG